MVILSGDSTLLGASIAPILRNNFQVFSFDDDRGSVSDPSFVRSLVDKVRPRAFVYCTPAFDPVACAYDPERAYYFNARLPASLAATCRDAGVVFVAFSSSHVFGSPSPSAHRDDEEPHPISTFGDSLALGETQILASSSDSLIVRIAELCHPDAWFIGGAVRSLYAGKRVPVVCDWRVSPTSLSDCANALAGLLLKDHHGIVNVSCAGSDTMRSVIDMAAGRVSDLRGVDAKSMIDEVDAVEFVTPYDFPLSAVLDISLLSRVASCNPRPWQEALRECVEAIIASGQ